METKIEINENSIFVNGVEYIKKEQLTPKDGEVWCVADMDMGEKWVFIKKGDECLTCSYVAFTPADGYIDITTGGGEIIADNEIEFLRPATPEETALLHSKLAERGKRWNAEKKCLEDLPKPLKEGELVIGWDEDKEDAFIGTYNGQKHRIYLVGIVHMDNAIPFESIEQYKEFIKG